MTRDWNAVRFDPDKNAGHVESYFFKLNDAAGRRALWLKATILARPGRQAVAEAWAVAFDREGTHTAVKRVTPFSEASFSRERFNVQVTDVRFRDGRAEGRIETASHSIEFGLDFDTASPPLVPFPSPRMYEGKLPSSKLVSPHPDSRFWGQYRVDGGKPVIVEGWRGMQGHNWGSRHTEQYAWAHVNQWAEDEDVVFEGLTGRVKIGPVLAPPLSIVCIWHRGTRYEFNAPRVLLRSHGEIGTRSWRFEVESPLARASGEFSADTKDFVGLFYENPDGQMTYCLNSKIATARVSLEARGRAPLVLTSRSAALEIGTKDPDHGVQMLA